MYSKCSIHKLNDLRFCAFSSTYRRCIYSLLFLNFPNVSLFFFFWARANLSRFLVENAATRKQLAQVQGQLENMERKNKEMLQWFLNVIMFVRFLNIQNQDDKFFLFFFSATFLHSRQINFFSRYAPRANFILLGER